jgi:TonB family protein
MRGFATAISIAALVGTALADSPGAPDIIQRTRRAYANLKSYQFQLAKERRTLAPEHETMTRTTLFMAWDHSGRFRLEPKGSLGLMIVSSGENTWVYNESLKQYTNSAGDPTIEKAFSMTADGVPLFPDTSENNAVTMSADDELTVSGSPHACYVIEVQYRGSRNGPGAARWAQFWVDKTTYLILKRVLHEHFEHVGSARQPSDVTTTVSVTSLEVDQPVLDDLFRFEPPSDAQQVERFDASRPKNSGPSVTSADLIDKPAADFKLRDLDGREVQLSSLRGKVVLLDFWATWCGPCRAEMPAIEKIYRKEKDIEVFGIDVGEDREIIQKFLRDQKITYPILLAAQSRVQQDYAANALPSVVILDKNGVIRSYKKGYKQGIEKGLREDLEDTRHAFPVAHARVISKRAPEYTAEARDAHLSGAVTLHLTVSPQGTPSGVRVTGPLGHGLDEKAIDAVQGWKFEPAMREGQPIAEEMNVEVAFSLTAPSQSAPSEPRTAEEAYRRGAHLVQTDHAEDAIGMYDKAIVLRPDWALAFHARASAFVHLKKYEEAIHDFDEAIRLDPAHPGWYDGRGLAYSNSGQHDRALDDYDRAIEMSQLPVGGYFNNRGWANLELGHAEKAIPDLTKAVQLLPDYRKAYENRAQAYAALKDWAHAIADYTAAMDLGPNRWQYEKRAEARRASGDAKGADEDARQAAAMNDAPH